MIHHPVMLDEVLEYLDPADDEIYADATFGAGGYSRAILGKAACNLISFDCDPRVKEIAESFKAEFKERFNFCLSNYSEIKQQLNLLGKDKLNGIVFDLGVSSMQLDEAERGFSFAKDAKLDMRMSQSGLSAYDVVNDMDEAELADIIYKFGDEHNSRRIAKNIVKVRGEKPIETTAHLAEIVENSIKRRSNFKINPATKTFQAIRIFVNDELGRLEKALESLKEILAENARIVIVTFHSLEDRIVKNYFKKNCGKAQSFSRYEPVTKAQLEPVYFEEISRKAIAPSQQEIELNPRSRSAKLRAYRRTSYET